MSPRDDPNTYAPVLERMVEILGSTEDGTTLGQAMDRASAELRIPIPKHMEEPLLVSVFKVISSGRLPGCPDA